MKLRIMSALVTFTLGAAVGALAQPKAAQTDPDTREIAQYRLTMEGVHKVAAATRAMAAEMKNDPRVLEMKKLDEQIQALETKEERTEAEEEQLEKLNARQEELERAFGGMIGSNPKSLSDMAARIEKVPAMAKALRAAGMTPREYSTFMLAMMQAAMVAGFQKSGMVKEIPKDVNPENVKFILDHEKELQALQKEMQSLAPTRK